MKNIETKTIKVNEKNPERELILEGADFIKEGKLVAFPTETVYGLGANGLDKKAVRSIFRAKGRPSDNPLILHISSIDQVEELVKEIPEEARMLMERFWPGPLTLLFEKSGKVPEIITAGLDTVAIRMPNHPIALELIKESGVPIAAPSANTSGRPSPTYANHVLEDLNGRIHMILDGGATGIGLESTVLDLSGAKPMILRPGGVTLEALKKLIPNVVEDRNLSKDGENYIPKSPGQKYRHYAPEAEMLVFVGDENNIVYRINHEIKRLESQGKKVGIMTTDELKDRYHGGLIISLGSRSHKEVIAQNLFNTIRQFDEENVDIILAEGIERSELGNAIMNRLKKAAAGNIVKV